MALFEISSLDCSTDVGKIAAAHDNKMLIFEPQPQQPHQWVQTAVIETEITISVMSFNLEGTRLIIGGQTLQLWTIESANWQRIWHCKTANNITYLKYSPDGTLFCSASKSDRLVKIWYESVIKIDFSFIYIAHPMPVTGFEWRRTSKYTPRGAIANVLITSCKDNISRLWVQTLLPDDGLVNFNQLKDKTNADDLVNQVPRVQTQRHGQKLLKRLKRMKAFSQFKKRQSLALDHSIDELEKVAGPINQITNVLPPNQIANEGLTQSNGAPHPNGLTARANINNADNNNQNSMPTALSAHDFHSYAICSTVVKPGLHFHLAGIIEPDFDTDTQSLSSAIVGDSLRVDASSSADILEEGDHKPQFVVHWINNKEIHITRSIELLLHDMLLRILKGNNPPPSSTNSPQSAGESCSGSENDTGELDDPNDDTITAESSKKLRHKLCRKMNKQRALAASGRPDPSDSDENSHSNKSAYPVSNDVSASPTSLIEEFDKILESLLKKWQMSVDLLFSINKSDGTLTVWQAKYLDGEDIGVFRQVQLERLTQLKAALPHYYSITMSLNVTAYSPGAYQNVKRAYLALANSSSFGGEESSNVISSDQFTSIEAPDLLSINTAESATNQSRPEVGSLSETKDSGTSGVVDAELGILIVTQHLTGILGLWKLNFDSNFPKVQNIELVSRITGFPIDPLWLRDGILIVEYDDTTTSLTTRWIADDSRRKSTLKSPVPQTHTKSNPFNFDEIKSSLVCNLPSVDEEAASQPKQEQKFSEEESQSDIKDVYRASQLASNISILPQYHLKQLIELLAFGKLQRVKAILNHLVNCLVSLETNNNRDTDPTSPAPWAQRSRTLSVVAQSASAFHDTMDIDSTPNSIQQQVFGDIELDYNEVTSIRPLPLYALLDADVEKPQLGDSKAAAQEEFSASYDSIMKSRSQVDATLDEILGKSTMDTLNKQKELKRMASDATGISSLTKFSPKKAKLLTQVLTHTLLPGLSNIDQMHLLAVADAVALFDASPDDLNDQDEDDSNQGAIMISTNIAIDSLDDRGLRFLTAMRQHVYLTRCLPMKQRGELKASGIGNHNIVWAFHSETQDELISLIPCVQRNKPEWAELKEFGIGWWLKKLEVLRKLIEKVAQSAYQARQDPLDAALFYLAMKKKTLVCALLRRVNCDKRLLKLFEQDFNDPVNRKKALKNAYALLGLHRFEHAAAFFILAGSIWDAVEVCINNLNDIQLAIVLIRLYDNDANLPSNLKRLLFTEILGSKRPTESPASPTSIVLGSVSGSLRNSFDRRASSAGQSVYNYDSKRAHQDPFLRSMAFWKLGDYLSSVHTLLENDVGSHTHRTSVFNTSRRNSENVNSPVQHDSIEQLSPSGKDRRGNVSVSASVFNFYLFLKDQPLVVKHKQQLLEETEIKKRTTPVEEEQVHCHRARSLSSGELGFDEKGISRAIKQSSTEFEVLNETTRLVDKYSDEVIRDKERVLFFSTASAYLEAGCPLLALEILCREDHLNMSQAQRMKFVACLHILMNELNTLASSGQSSSNLESHFIEWLQRSVDTLKKICSYVGLCLSGHIIPSADQTVPGTDSSSSICSGEAQEVIGSQVGGTQWVRINEPILRAMLTYCNLHSATENSLTTVRLKLLGLLRKISSTSSHQTQQ